MVRSEVHEPPTVARGKGLYTQAIAVDAASVEKLVFISGQVAWDATGELVGRNDLKRQVVQVYENLRSLAESAGGSLDSIVQLRTYLTNRALIPQFAEIRKELYPELFPGGRYPTNTLLAVEGLAHPDFLIEVEAIAVI